MRKQNEETMGEVIKRMFGELNLEENYRKNQVKGLVKDLLGPGLHKYVTRIGMREGVLHITVEESVVRSELTFARENLRTHLNEAIGEEYVREIVVK
jgi:hypothetical protein